MFRHRTIGRNAVAIALLAFHVLAAGRALVPGMCQTQEAAKDGSASCCATVCPARGPESQNPALNTDAEEHPACPFCHLVCTAAHSAPASTAAIRFAGVVEPCGWDYAAPHSLPASSSHPVRAPPLLNAPSLSS